MDRTTRRAAMLATAVVVPVTVVVAFALIMSLPVPAPSTAPTPRQQATGPVTTTALPLPPAAAGTCHELAASLPGSLRELARRAVTTGQDQSAAYGDPPILLACAVPPASYPPAAFLWLLNDVCWYAETEPGATVWTTVDRPVVVRVRVPEMSEPAGQWVVDFSDPVAATVPQLERIPPACTRKSR
jgi:hypothetical protein